MIEKREAYDLVIATSWVNKLLSLKEDTDPELSARLNDLLAYVGEAKVGHLAVQEILSLGESCVRPLLSYLKSRRALQDPGGCEKAAEALEKLAPSWAIKELIDLLASQNGTVRFHAARALERLTGETQGRTAEAWRDQAWEQGADSYRAWAEWWRAHGKDRSGTSPTPFLKG